MARNWQGTPKGLHIDLILHELSKTDPEGRPRIKAHHPDGSEGVIVDNHVVVTKGERLGERAEFGDGWRVVWGGES